MCSERAYIFYNLIYKRSTEGLIIITAQNANVINLYNNNKSKSQQKVGDGREESEDGEYISIRKNNLRSEALKCFGLRTPFKSTKDCPTPNQLLLFM